MGPTVATPRNRGTGAPRKLHIVTEHRKRAPLGGTFPRSEAHTETWNVVPVIRRQDVLQIILPITRCQLEQGLLCPYVFFAPLMFCEGAEFARLAGDGARGAPRSIQASPPANFTPQRPPRLLNVTFLGDSGFVDSNTTGNSQGVRSRRTPWDQVRALHGTPELPESHLRAPRTPTKQNLTGR